MLKKVILVFILCLPLLVRAESGSGTSTDLARLLEMDLLYLGQVIIDSPAALTETERRKIPSTVTVISRDMIDHSGARSLDEVFNIFVPSYQTSVNLVWGNELNLRGNSSSDGFLLLLNGRIMNSSHVFGPITERNLSMLGDIQSIEFVRGPGSSIYGPGAITGVINIKTLNKGSWEGADVTVKQGLVEDFTTVEFRYGHRFNEEDGLFMHYGVDYYPGMTPSNAPYFLSLNDAAVGVVAGKANTFGVSHYNGAFDRDLRHKFHLQFNLGNLETWFRWARGGVDTTANYGSSIRHNGFSNANVWGNGYQQLTGHAKYKYDFNRDLKLVVSAGYDTIDMFVRQRSSTFADPSQTLRTNHREEEFNIQPILRWTPNPHHAFALGYEFAYETFGNETLRFPDEPVNSHFRPVDDDSWNITTHALFGEYQWTINDRWTMFADMRIDKHRYTDFFFSPKAALIYTPTVKDTIKLSFNRSVRANIDPQLHNLVLGGGTGDDEAIDFVELSYNHIFTSHLQGSVNAYRGDQEVVSFQPFVVGGGSGTQTPVGNRQYYGLEFELNYQSDLWHVLFSHNYSQLIDFELLTPGTRQRISAAPAGFGNDDYAISNHVTKLYARYNIKEDWSVYSSLNILWGFPGSEDFADFNNQQTTPDFGLPLTDGRDDAFDGSYYLNFGSRYEYSDKITVSADAYNILGLFDDSLNKVNMRFPFSEYREVSPSLALSFRYKF
jgi:outer membrane receptor protein involved in Fe transport